MSIERKSTRELQDIAREIDADIRGGRLTRREEDLATRDLKIIIDELEYRESLDRPKERSYGGGYSNDNRSNKDVGSFFNKTSEVTMTPGSMFGSGGMNKGFAPEPKYTQEKQEVYNKSTTKHSSRDEQEKKVCFIPKYPFVTSKNVKEVLETSEQTVGQTLWLINKREFSGNDDGLEFNFKYIPDCEINPLFNNEKGVAYITDISNPKIPKTVINITDDETVIAVDQANKVITKFIFNEISLDMTNSIQAIDYYIKLNSLEDIKAFLSKTDFKTEYLKHISKIYKSFKVDIKEEYLELNLNKKHVYADIPDMVIPDGEKFFVSEASNETLYTLLKSISVEKNNFIGIIEGYDFKFQYYIGYNRILLVRA